jgi:hypothetical protein
MIIEAGHVGKPQGEGPDPGLFAIGGPDEGDGVLLREPDAICEIHCSTRTGCIRMLLMYMGNGEEVLSAIPSGP